MKIYISLPMKGHEKTVRKRYEDAVKFIKENLSKDAEICGPKNIEDFDYTGYTKSAANGFREMPWNWYIGEDVKDLLTCDAIYMTRGWAWSKGCKVEYAIARAMDFTIIMAEDATKKLEDITNEL